MLRGWKGERVAKVDAHKHRLTPLSHKQVRAKYPWGWEICVQILPLLARKIQALFIKRLGHFVMPVIAETLNFTHWKTEENSY